MRKVGTGARNILYKFVELRNPDFFPPLYLSVAKRKDHDVCPLAAGSLSL
jgi:hypothetical protein